MQPPAQLLADNPNFAQLWGKLAAQLTDEGILRDVASDYENSRQQLLQERQRYMEHTTLLDVLNEHLESFNVLSASSESRALDAENLKRAGLSCPGDVYRSLDQSCKVAEVMQRLHLSESQTTAQTRPALYAAGADQAIAGTTEHILGLAPDILAELLLPEKKEMQVLHASVVPELEARLAQRVARITTIIRGTPDNKAPGNEVSLDKVVARKVVAVQDSQSAAMQAAGNLIQAALQHLHLLSQVHELLAGAVRDLLLGSQARLDGGRCELLHAQCAHHLGKLKALEAQLLAATYTKDNVEALKVIHGLLSQAQAEAAAAVESISMQLNAYDSVGPELLDIAREFGVVKAELARASDMFGHFNQLQQELGSRQ